MEESEKPWEAKSLHEQLEDLQASADQLEHQHATLLSQMFEQKAVQQEATWRRQHA